MSKQQTSVEWLFEKITSNFWDIKECQHLLEQAKKMEKKQIKDAFFINCTTHPWFQTLFETQFEQYYNETFNKPNQ